MITLGICLSCSGLYKHHSRLSGIPSPNTSEVNFGYPGRLPPTLVVHSNLVPTLVVHSHSVPTLVIPSCLP